MNGVQKNFHLIFRKKFKMKNVPFGNKIENKCNKKLPSSNMMIYFYNKFILLQIFSIIIILFASSTVWAEENSEPIRFGLTPAIIHNQYGLLIDWREYLQKKLRRPVEFVSRDSYRETIDLIKQKKIDFAWVSDYPYVYLEDKRLARLLVTPLYQGRPYYCSYLIVPSSDLTTKSLLQLKGKIFAYADPYSNSGHLVPRYQLQQAGEDPNRFFRKTFFTWGHRRIVEAVAQGLVDAGSLDSFVWDTLSIIQPDLTNQTRIVAKSPEYGFPPIVARRNVNRADSAAMQQALLDMANDPEGAKLLKRLNLSGFAPGDAKLYDGVRKMMHTMADL
ncbi:phosphate/phosphite/phosphonate ABC transporter substrate-binding protein [Sulfuricella sp.]|uniref:substrate-binding domain-containing protein n=1 Tax=Sulfuricella sp. TaxID=2099377 RepID=UPI002CEA396C|nr:phosphate/phosphite/phosphonate ABC transporter substrate-binding protein [Sulfuricella sp.]HUX63504.1 phosphate/phosphite/phosphonate ABC transporter substrate-binding protein [Sulfuricella sp.]